MQRVSIKDRYLQAVSRSEFFSFLPVCEKQFTKVVVKRGERVCESIELGGGDGLIENISKCVQCQENNKKNSSSRCLAKKYQANAVQCVGLIVSGRINAYSVSNDGSRVLISTLEAGSCFGINNLFYGEDIVAELVSVEKSIVFYIEKSVVREIIESNTEYFKKYAELTDRKLQFLLKRIRLLTMTSCRNKLIEYLLDNGKEVINILITKEDLSKQLAMSRTALFRELKLLEEEGIIRVALDRIEIVDIEKLKSRFDRV